MTVRSVIFCSTSASLAAARACNPASGRRPWWMGPGLQQVGDLGQGESQTLRGLDHPQQGHRLLRVHPMPAQGAVRLLQQPTSFVVPQGLQVHPRRGRDLAGAQSLAHRVTNPAADLARSTRASSTATCPAVL